MPTTYTQDNFQTRAIDVVHINPSIMEGRFLNHSLLGPGTAIPLDRYPPVNTTQPFLVGSGVIPNRIVCEVGTWVASPTPDYSYQWMADGVDIPGATSYEIFTDETFDGVTLTCEVVANNGIGQDNAITSNSILCSLIEPIETRELEFAAITGLRANKLQTVMAEQDYILSGIGAEDRLDVNRGVAYFLTGIGTDDRQDINEMPIISITGLQQSDYLSVIERDIGIAVINSDEGVPLVDSVRQPIHLKNYNAELGTFGWTVFGALIFSSSASGILSAAEGGYSWMGGLDVHPEGANTPYTYISQDCYLWDVWHADIDAGLCSLELEWLQGSLGPDTANIKVEYYAADGTTLIGFDDGPGLWSSPSSIWFHRSFEDTIPSGTRYVRIYAEFNWDNTGDNNINAQIDNIKPFIRKGPKLTNRSYGPTFENWRIRFTTSNTWSGGALSEAEFLDAPAGTDLATGGSIIFGSAGFGVVNADGAFNDILSDYWAGAENAIVNDTSWVGYNMGTPVKPQAITLTARPGSNALQMGQSWVVEGSDDGIRWTPVEIFDTTRVARTFNSGETREFAIGHGTQTYLFEAPYVIPSFGGNDFSSDDYSMSAMVFRTFSRFNLERFKFYLANQSHDYLWQVVRINGQKSTSWYYGMVSELHEDGAGSHDDGGSPSYTTVTKEHVLASPLLLEPGEEFAIIYIDHLLQSNPNTVQPGTNNGDQNRLLYVSNWNGGGDHEARSPHFRKLSGWQSNQYNLLPIGFTNSGPFTNGGIGYTWGIDFQGSFF